MTDQITHKKQLKRINKDRRTLLKQYYNLDDNVCDVNNQVYLKSKDLHDDSASLTNPELPENIQNSTLQQLVQMHNVLLSKEIEANDMIKNTIYENYYDLIKVDDLLKSIINQSDNIQKVKEVVEMVKKIKD